MSRAQSCKKLKRSELFQERSENEDVTTLEGLLDALPGGGARRKILSSVVYFLPVYSQVQTVLSGVFKEEVFFTESNEAVNLREFLLLEKNKMICRFRKMSTTYIRNIGSVKTTREFYDTTDLVDLIRVPLKQHFNNPPAHFPKVARLCYGTPLSLACKKGDLDMVRTILQFKTLWGEALGVRLKSGADIVNVAAMPLKNCIDVVGTAGGEFYTRGDNLRRATRNELSAAPVIDIVSNWGCSTMWERKNPFLPLSETLNIILAHACNYPMNDRVFSKVKDSFFQSITDRYFTILKMLMKNGAQVTYVHIKRLCSLNKNGFRLQQIISKFGNVSGNYHARTVNEERMMEENVALWKLSSEYRTRVLNILLPYVPDGAKLKMLEDLIKVIVDAPKIIAIDLFCEISSTNGYMANVKRVLSDNPKLSTIEFSRVRTHGEGAPISALIDMIVKEGKVPIDSEKKTSNNGRRKMLFPYLLELFHVLLSYKKWSSNPGAMQVPYWVLGKIGQTIPETCPWTVTDIFYLVHGSWHESCQRMYLERLHPLILQLKGVSDSRGGIVVDNHMYLNEILKEEVHWREGGDVLIKKRKEAFMMKLWRDKLKFLQEEGKYVQGKMDRGVSWIDDDAEIVKFFPDNKLRRSYGIRLSSSETYENFSRDDDLWPSRREEFQVSFSESRQRNKQKREIQEAEKHFDSVRGNFRIRNWEREDFKRLFPHFQPGDETVEWYAIFGELFLHLIPRWKENKLLKEYFTTHITTRSLYGVDSQTNSSSSQ